MKFCGTFKHINFALRLFFFPPPESLNLYALLYWIELMSSLKK